MDDLGVSPIFENIHMHKSSNMVWSLLARSNSSRLLHIGNSVHHIMLSKEGQDILVPKRMGRPCCCWFRNPANHLGCIKPLKIMGCFTYQLVSWMSSIDSWLEFRPCWVGEVAGAMFSSIFCCHPPAPESIHLLKNNATDQKRHH